MTLSGIYSLTFVSGKRYVGKSINIEQRYANHCSKLKSGTSAAPLYLEYSKSNILPKLTVLEYSDLDLSQLELKYYNKLLSEDTELLNSFVPKT